MQEATVQGGVSMDPLLKLSHVSFSYHEAEGETLALSDISFTLEPGKFLAVVGPSGCGKSTLLSLICGLLTPEEGSILLQGVPLKEARTNIGYMLQRDHLFVWCKGSTSLYFSKGYYSCPPLHGKGN